jgi:hypothetical protein
MSSEEVVLFVRGLAVLKEGAAPKLKRFLSSGSVMGRLATP